MVYVVTQLIFLFLKLKKNVEQYRKLENDCCINFMYVFMLLNIFIIDTGFKSFNAY